MRKLTSRKIIVGTRGSDLALAQAKAFIDEMEEIKPNWEYEIKIISTYGDLNLQKQISEIGGKGVFVREVQDALLSGKVDICVHSSKDVPAASRPAGTRLLPFWIIGDDRDCIVCKNNVGSLEDLGQGARLGTGSQRREVQLKRLRPDLEIVPIRGNIQTRISKIESENLDGVVLAMAGLERLGFLDLLEEKVLPLAKSVLVPSPGQGIIGLEFRDGDPLGKIIREKISDEVYYKFLAERSFLGELGGDCMLPLGATASYNHPKKEISIKAFLHQGTSVFSQKTFSAENLNKEIEEMVKEMKDGH